MLTGDLLKIMADTVAEYQNCVLEVMIGKNVASAQLIPLSEFEGDYEDEED